MIRVRAARPLTNFVVAVDFTDGSCRTIDLAPFLRGPIFEPLLDAPALFATLTVDPALGTFVWPNGADIDPDVLYEGLVPAAWT